MSLKEVGLPAADVQCDMCGMHLDPRVVRYLWLNWGWRGRSSFLSKDQHLRDERMTLCGPHADKLVAMIEKFQLANKVGRTGRSTGLDRDDLPATFDG